MRIILLLAVGLGAAAIGTAAATRPPGAGGTAFGRVVSPQGAPSNGGRHYPGRGGSPHFRPGFGQVDGRHDRFGRFARNDFRPYDNNVGYYGSPGIEWPVEGVDPHGNGFFAGRGGQIRLQGGRPQYDYDRGYPYEWASAASAGEAGRREARAIQAPPRCTMESGVRVCRGW